MATRKTTTTKTATANKEPEKDTVLVQLPIIEGESDSVFVSVNLKNYQIKRGVQVEVPRAVAEVLANSSKQMMEAREKQSKLASKNYGEV
jgi:hypothetical protein